MIETERETQRETEREKRGKEKNQKEKRRTVELVTRVKEQSEIEIKIGKERIS